MAKILCSLLLYDAIEYFAKKSKHFLLIMIKFNCLLLHCPLYSVVNFTLLRALSRFTSVTWMLQVALSITVCTVIIETGLRWPLWPDPSLPLFCKGEWWLDANQCFFCRPNTPVHVHSCNGLQLTGCHSGGPLTYRQTSLEIVTVKCEMSKLKKSLALKVKIKILLMNNDRWKHLRTDLQETICDCLWNN